MKYQITLLNEPNQSLDCNLTDNSGNVHQFGIGLRTLPDGQLIADLTVNGEGQRYSVTCCDRMPLLPTDILNGNVYFEDLYGRESPSYKEFNNRFVLIYDTEFKVG